MKNDQTCQTEVRRSTVVAFDLFVEEIFYGEISKISNTSSTYRYVDNHNDQLNTTSKTIFQQGSGAITDMLSIDKISLLINIFFHIWWRTLISP